MSEILEQLATSEHRERDPRPYFTAERIVREELLTDEWQGTRALAYALRVQRGMALAALSILDFYGYARRGEEKGPSAFGGGNYVWQLGRSLKLPLCHCGTSTEHVWNEQTPESNVHEHRPSGFAHRAAPRVTDAVFACLLSADGPLTFGEIVAAVEPELGRAAADMSNVADSLEWLRQNDRARPVGPHPHTRHDVFEAIRVAA